MEPKPNRRRMNVSNTTAYNVGLPSRSRDGNSSMIVSGQKHIKKPAPLTPGGMGIETRFLKRGNTTESELFSNAILIGEAPS